MRLYFLKNPGDPNVGPTVSPKGIGIEKHTFSIRRGPRSLHGNIDSNKLGG